MKILKNDRDGVLDGIINDAIRIKEEFESRSGFNILSYLNLIITFGYFFRCSITLAKKFFIF